MVDGLAARLRFAPLDEDELVRFPATGRMSWARLLLPDALADLDRVVYLDADTFVVRPLSPLWELRLEGQPIAAVTNVIEPVMYDHVASLGIEDRKLCFNGGVLVIDLDQWRRESISDQLRAFAAGRPADSFPWWDQDALNAVLADRRTPMHPRWNAMNSLWNWRGLAVDALGEAAVDEAVGDPAVLHFEGPSLCKPWHYLCEHPWRETYRSLLRQTPWGDVAIEDRTIGTRLIARLPKERRLAAFKRLDRARTRVGGLRDRIGR
jgi:lipopolysaccharide biosynthesis glycosyltransferase